MRFSITVIVVLAIAYPTWADDENPLDAAAESTSNDPDELISLGHLYVEAHRFKEAKKIYKRALRLNKKSGEARYGLARIQMEKGNFHKAKRACKAITRTLNSKSVGRICSGWFWLGNNRAGRADEEFLKAIEMGDTKRGKTGMGEVYMKRGDFDKALNAFTEAIEAGAGHTAHIGRGLALEAMGDKDGGILALEKAVLLQPASSLAAYHFGRLLEPGDKSLASLQVALQIRPEWTDATIEIGNTYVALGDLDSASEAFNSAAQTAPNRSDALFGLGQVLYKAGKPTEAKDALNRAIELVPTYADAHLLVADIHKDEGNVDAASESFRRARESRPKDVSVYLRSGAFYFEIDRYTTARSYLNRAVAMDPNLSHAHIMLGRIACSRRLYSEGQGHFERAAGGDVSNVDIATIDELKASCKKP